MKVQDYLKFIDNMAPFETAESYDNVGLIVGDGDQEVSGILLALDITKAVIKEAVAMGANLVITHHPIIFTPIKSVVEQDANGSIIREMIRNDISLISAHTNLDRAEYGTNYALINAIGANISYVSDDGFLWEGKYEQPMEFSGFTDNVKSKLGATHLGVVGDAPLYVKTITMCSGSGASEYYSGHMRGCDVFLTGELKHSAALEAMELGTCVVAAGHHETEQVVLPLLGDHLQNYNNSVQCNVEIKVSVSGESPIRYL